ncbi:MAG: ComEA family DNA-binding protein [Candidatus Pacebacteria bacterium]|nr:ComEA family DNA-binding protein [Candidatus Paceibacterota bacterium]
MLGFSDGHHTIVARIFPFISTFIGIFSFGIGLYLYFAGPRQDPPQLHCISQVEEATVSVRPKQIATYISGAVQKPGVYMFDEGSLIQDGVERAGGFSKMADPYYLARSFNLSERLTHELHVYVPAKDEAQILAQICRARKVPVNTATLMELQQVLEVGETRAKTVIEHRPYLSFDDFAKRSELPKSVLETSKSRITFSTEEEL